MSNFETIKIANIERDAEYKKAGVRYIMSVIDQHREDITKAFIKDDISLVPRGVVDSILYNNLTKSLEDLVLEITRPSEVNHRDLTINDHAVIDDPLVQMGWASYYPLSRLEDVSPGAKVPHALGVTESGLKVVNGWMSALGQESIQDQVARLQAL